MARFRKGTNDHDGDGAKGGSLKAGSRFVKGTTDHDNDGNRGGSLPKGDDMAKETKKAPVKKAVAARKAAVEEQFAEADAKADPAVEEATLSRQIRGW